MGLAAIWGGVPLCAGHADDFAGVAASKGVGVAFGVRTTKGVVRAASVKADYVIDSGVVVHGVLVV